MKKWQAYIGVVISAIFWGTIPVFTRVLYAQGFSTTTVPAMRGLVSALISIVGLIAFKDYKQLQIKEIPFYLVYGTLAIASCYTFYSAAIQMVSTAMAAVLLYTGTAFVNIFNRIFFKVPITPVKWVALVATFGGCIIVVKAYDSTAFLTNLPGIIVGLLSGLCYSLTTVLGTKAREKHSGRVNAWLIMGFSSLTFLVLLPPWKIPALTLNQGLLFIGMGVVCSFIPYTLYLICLDSEVDGGTASILATIEPVIATLFGVFLFNDKLEFAQIVGMMIVLVGVLLPIFAEQNVSEGCVRINDQKSI